MKGIIIGAGIGGLTTAIALQKAGIDFEIMEAAPELKPVGAGIVMASNAMQVFKRLGIEQDIISAGQEVAEAYGTDEAFNVISGLRVKQVVVPIYGMGSYALHRGRLQQVLLSKLQGKTVQLNRRLSSVKQEGEGVFATFEDQITAEADFIIGADGIKSAVRKSLMGEIPYRYTGQTCWRGMADFSLPQAQRNISYEMWGRERGLRFGYVPTADNEVYYFTTYFTPANGRDEPGKVKQTLLKLYSRFGKWPAQLIEATPEDKIIRSDISDFIPLKQWSKGQIALMGDAAHATTPNLGQGGCQAVEDAFVIAQCLKEEKSVENAFQRYQAIRYEKAKYVVDTSWRFSELTNIKNPILQKLRNILLKSLPERMALSALKKIFYLNY
ncbi:MAG TPA: FAD-dependent monooxygenase [Cyclobacteriaceae bacterium]|nr:FAD-dependent monooxygenase [Cyclobacteriaceae bacterium]